MWALEMDQNLHIFQASFFTSFHSATSFRYLAQKSQRLTHLNNPIHEDTYSFIIPVTGEHRLDQTGKDWHQTRMCWIRQDPNRRNHDAAYHWCSVGKEIHRICCGWITASNMTFTIMRLDHWSFLLFPWCTCTWLFYTFMMTT